MAINLNEQKPATTNQIEQNKPKIFGNANKLQGYVCGSCNAGHIVPMGYFKVRPGEKIYNYNIKQYITMLTPLTPSYQGIKLTLKAYFVPDSRVWKNAEKYYAQKGGYTNTKIKVKPNTNGTEIDNIELPFETDGNKYANVVDTEIWRDCWASKYIPRVKSRNGLTVTNKETLPIFDILPLRGFVAIYNDFERNKEYDTAIQEFNADTTSKQEITNYIPGFFTLNGTQLEHYMPRAKRNNSYYTDYRTELVGQDTAEPQSTDARQISDLTEWEKRISEYRSQAENAQKTDWQIIAELGGTRQVKDGKVQLIGQRTIGLNFQIITQSTYNDNPNVAQEFQSLGTQGAYSFTDVSLNLINNTEIIENGYVHIIGEITTDTIFETGIDRELLNITWDSEYRPDMKELKDDVLYKKEIDTTSEEFSETEIIGYKRKFNEMFKLPNIIYGDVCETGYYQMGIQNTVGSSPYTYLIAKKERTLPRKTYAYGERDVFKNYKKYWKDYSDIYVNNNQAIKQKVLEVGTALTNQGDLVIEGQNQFLYVGKNTLIAELPVDQSIRDNFTKWGEM